MKTITAGLLATSLYLLVTLPAQAGCYHDDSPFRDRIDRQQQRIWHGIENGQLTRKQAKALKKQHRKLRRLDRKFGHDGHYSREEKHILHKKLGKANKRIRKFKHDDKYAYIDWHSGHQGSSLSDDYGFPHARSHGRWSQRWW